MLCTCNPSHTFALSGSGVVRFTFRQSRPESMLLDNFTTNFAKILYTPAKIGWSFIKIGDDAAGKSPTLLP